MMRYLFAYALLALLILCESTGKAATGKLWRRSENGGLNVLFCLLAANSKRVTYDELLKRRGEMKEGSAETSYGLSRLAAECGFPLRTASLTMEELNSCTLPMLVHVDGRTPEAGAFLLLIRLNQTSIAYMNGPSACVQSMSREDFRRIWNGFALLPASKQPPHFEETAAGFVAGVLLTVLASIVIGRMSKRPHQKHDYD